MNYETTPEDETRRKIIPTRDYRLDTGWANRCERAVDYGVYKCRQGFDIFTKHVRSEQMVYGVIGFLICVWLSGWFANANSDMSFESLLMLVVGVVVLLVTSLTKGVKK